MSGLTRTDYRLQKSREVYRLLRQNMRRMTYTEVANAVGTGHRCLGGPLGIIQEECNERFWPTITVWVVSKTHGFPSIGCNAQTREEVDREEARVRATPWPAEPWW